MSTQDSLVLIPCKKKCLANGDDLISNLHESVLSHILSMLPTKDAVRTSILSKDWKNKWTCMYRMKLVFSSWEYVDIHKYATVIDPTSFVNFLERLLLYAHRVTDFSLACSVCSGTSEFTKWICDIFGRDNIESLKLEFRPFFPKDNVEGITFSGKLDIVLPWSLLDKFSMKVLKLRIPRGRFNVVSQNSFRNLKSFHLDGIEILNENSNSDTLVLKFPVLEIFEVEACKWVNVKLVKIYAPLMTTFISHVEDLDNLYGHPNDYSIEIIGSKVSTYESSGDFPDSLVLTGSQVVCASFSNLYDESYFSELRSVGLNVLKILNESSRLNELELSEFLVLALISGPPLRKHDEMKILRLFDPVTTEQLFELLHVAPSLKLLSMNVTSCEEYNYDAAVEIIPCCIVSHLEEVQFDSFTGSKNQYNLAKCLLKNGQKLKKISIYDRVTVYKRDSIANRLSKFPRISTNLMIVFLSRNVAKTFIYDKMEQLQQRPRRLTRKPDRLC